MTYTKFLKNSMGVAVGVLICSCSQNHWRDVPVSEVTLAEPLLAQSKLSSEIQKLRSEHADKEKLACALAELSVVHSQIGSYTEATQEAEEAQKLFTITDKKTHTSFLIRRALAWSQFNAATIPDAESAQSLSDLEHMGKDAQIYQASHWLDEIESDTKEDRDKAQVENDLAVMWGAQDGWLANVRDRAEASLDLRVRFAGANSLEVAESLCTVSRTAPSAFDDELCKKLRLSDTAASEEKSSWKERSVMCLERALAIQKQVLGEESVHVADTLVALDRAYDLSGDGKSSLKLLQEAVAIYEKQFGSRYKKVPIIYSILAQQSSDPKQSSEHQAKVQFLLTLQSPGKELGKDLYALLKASLSGQDKEKKQAFLDRAFTALGHPEVTTNADAQSSSDNSSVDTASQVQDFGIEKAEKFSVPQIDKLKAEKTEDNQLCIEGYKGGKRVLRQSIATWGSPNMDLTAVAKNKIEFVQYGADMQGREATTYKWTGHEFTEEVTKDTNPDRENFDGAINDALNGKGVEEGIACRCLGLYVDHESVLTSLSRARLVAHKLFKAGKSADAANRLHDMGELTCGMVRSTNIFNDDTTKDDAERWISAWMYQGENSVDITPFEWAPFVNDYAYYRQQAGDHDTAMEALAAVLRYCPNRVVAVLNLADSEYAVGKRSEARKHYIQYLELAKKQGVKNISSLAQKRAS